MRQSSQGLPGVINTAYIERFNATFRTRFHPLTRRSRTLASMLRIPVYMHNVPDQPFRPSAWNAFGTADREGADYRACDNFGPLYG